MKIYFRLSKDYKKQVKMIENTIFVSKTSKSVTFFPIPPFLKNPKCGCGTKAQFMLEDMSCVCSKCLNKPFVGVELKKEDDISISLTEWNIRNIKFEWSVNNDRWYTIYGRSLKPRNWKRFLSELKSMILHDKELSLEVDYEKETKILLIY